MLLTAALDVVYDSGMALSAIVSKGKVPMKFSSLSLLLVSLSAIAFGADPLTGRWKIHSNIAGNESDQTCTLTQKNSDFTGACTSEQGNTTISGKIDGNKVTWSYKSEFNGSPLTVSYEGKPTPTRSLAL